MKPAKPNSTNHPVAEHYTHGELMDAVLSKLAEAQVDIKTLSVHDLAPMDHLHGRGLVATKEMIKALEPQAGQRLIDIGSGIGGPARYIAAEIGCHITGVDLTPEFVAVAQELARMTGLAVEDSSRGSAVFEVANALDLPFDAETFDGGYTHNVSMSVPDKEKFFAEAFRVLKPDARFAAAEVTQGPGGDVVYPVPWAMSAEISHLTTGGETQALLETIGFRIKAVHESTEKALAYNANARERISRQGPPILTPLVILNERAVERMKNAARNLEQRRAVPMEFICIKP